MTVFKSCYPNVTCTCINGFVCICLCIFKQMQPSSDKLWRRCFWLFVCCSTFRTRIFCSWRDITFECEGLQSLGLWDNARHRKPSCRALYIRSDSWPRFLWSHTNDRPTLSSFTWSRRYWGPILNRVPMGQECVRASPLCKLHIFKHLNIVGIFFSQGFVKFKFIFYEFILSTSLIIPLVVFPVFKKKFLKRSWLKCW